MHCLYVRVKDFDRVHVNLNLNVKCKFVKCACFDNPALVFLGGVIFQEPQKRKWYGSLLLSEAPLSHPFALYPSPSGPLSFNTFVGLKSLLPEEIFPEVSSEPHISKSTLNTAPSSPTSVPSTRLDTPEA